MGKKQQTTADSTSDPKKRRRVGFSNIDTGVEANECIKIYLVSCKEEVGASDCSCIDPVDLNSFFEEHEKIYGYKGLKITVWVSIVSFQAYADVTFESSSDGGKGITDLKSYLQKIFAETLVESKDEFLQTFATETHFIRSTISKGEVLQQKATSDMEVVRMVMGSMDAGHLYSRLIPLILLLVDGSNPIDITDPCWEMYLLIQKNTDQQGDVQNRLIGFAAIYRFYRYPESSRLRLSQILILPPYQNKGHGRCLLKIVNDIAISENVYDLTIEEPIDILQHVRTCVDTLRLLLLDPVQQAVNLAVSRFKQGKISKKTHTPRVMPPSSVVENVRESLKISKKQFFYCWEILIYLGLDPLDKYLDDYVTVITEHMRADILGKNSGTPGKQVLEVPSDYNPEMSFVMFRSNAGDEASGVQTDENQTNQEEQLRALVDEKLKAIKLIAQKVSLHHLSTQVQLS